MARSRGDGRLRAKKRFGQHFLEPAWADKVVDAIAPQSDETILEIGPGPGILTTRLARRAARVVAFEIDRDMTARLQTLDLPRVTIAEGDFLDVTAQTVREALQAAGYDDGPLRVAGNLPYNVASPILFKLVDLFSAGLPLRDAAVMLQREVANRLLADPGTKDYGVLTVLIRHSAAVSRALQLPAGAFRPVPKVQSTVVRLAFHEPSPPLADIDRFRSLTQAVFSRRRKTIANALLAFSPAANVDTREALASAGIDPSRRPETLSIAELARLSDVLGP
jgi:16S rRNA (adenine1518-N6/adenine1519-N6)-dimethyltransferase